MLDKMLDLFCEVGLHRGKWVYDSYSTGTLQCDQTRICRRCFIHSFRIRHDVPHWVSDGFSSSTETGVCLRCQQVGTRQRPRRGVQ